MIAPPMNFGFLTNAGAATSPPGARSNGLRKRLAAVRRIVNAPRAIDELQVMDGRDAA